MHLHARDNKTEILEFLRNAWAKDRKAEWSIWMLYSKVEMPHHYINSGSHDSSNKALHRRVSNSFRVPEEVGTCMLHILLPLLSD